jgi:hypothetical protein
MSRIAVILIAILLIGCSSTTRKAASGESAPISIRSWQQLQTALRDAPVELRNAITQAGEARLQHVDQAVSLKATEFQESHALLLDILTHSGNQVLLKDAEFEGLHDVVIGETRQQQPYAAALADYLMQPDFGCQQPIYAAYFQRRYATGHAVNPCSTAVPFSVLTRHDGAQTTWLDPKRVRSIHLLFAGKSGSMASRFGHVALRLVVCPEGKSTDAECDANLFEHVVLGFQAHIDELSLNTLKALNGDYKAYLFANQFMDVYEEYAIGEFREVYSLPLRLDDAQRELMVRELADIHWRYAGKYTFFTRNCATMMQDSLRKTWPDFALNTKLKGDYLRPDSLFEAIKSSPLADGDKLTSLDVAEREGYFFSSTRLFYDRALNEVRAAILKPAFTDLESYLQINPVERRHSRTEDIKFSDRLAEDQHLHEAQIMLEEYAILRSMRELKIEAAKYFEQQNFLARAGSILSQMDTEHAKVFDECLLTPFKQYTSPIKRLNGIPDKSGIHEESHLESICQSTRSKELLHEAISGIKDAKSDQWQRLIEISQYWVESIANLNLLKQM